MNYQNFAQNLVSWFNENKRSLPFRNTKNPYLIWISEIMAQQTQIAQLLPYYQQWVRLWPNVQELAKAQLSEVYKAWEGLGYYSRANNLYKASQIIVNQYQGEFPSDYHLISNLPGVGPYTAGAIASIAFNQAKPAVDGNVIRVLSRVLANASDFSKANYKKLLEEYIVTLMKYEEPALITESLMELGALLCLPKSPKCSLCPVSEFCLAYQNQSIESYPYKKAKKEKHQEYYNVFIDIDQDRLLISTDDSDGLMKHLIRLPQLRQEEEIPYHHYEKLFSSKHVFSHKIWYMDVYKVLSPTKKLLATEVIHLNQRDQYSWITAHKKILNKVLSD